MPRTSKPKICVEWITRHKRIFTDEAKAALFLEINNIPDGDVKSYPVVAKTIYEKVEETK